MNKLCSSAISPKDLIKYFLFKSLFCIYELPGERYGPCKVNKLFSARRCVYNIKNRKKKVSLSCIPRTTVVT